MRGKLLLVAALLFVGAARPAAAQDVPQDTLRARVVQLAGSNIYLDRGMAAGILAGDTLHVLRAAVRGALHVLASDSSRSVVVFAAAPFPITRGEELVLVRTRRAPVLAADSAAMPAPSAEPAPPALVPPAAVVRQRAARVTGLMAVGGDWSSDGRGRSLIPSTALSLRASDLPLGLGARVYARAEHRSVSGTWHEIDEPLTVRIHTAALERRTGTVRASAGRFATEHDPFGGSWDGVLLGLVNGRFGAGIIGGLEPDYGAGAVSSQHPRGAVYAHGGADAAGLRYRGSAILRRYVDDVPAGRARSELGMRHSLTTAGVSAWTQMLVEQADSGAARLEHAQARVSIAVSDALRVHAGFRRDAPFAATGVGAVARGARDRIDAGVAHAGARASFGIDASTAATGNDRDYTVRTYLFAPDAFLGVELDAAAALFRMQDYSTVEGSVGAGHRIGSVHVRSLYRAQRTTLPLGSALVHELQLDASTAVTRRLRGSAALLHNRGGGVAGSRAFARVDWTF